MLTVVIPAYNEGRHIYKNLLQVCATLQGLDFEVIVVNDGSGDDTDRECQRVQAEGYPVIALRLDVNLGKGAALVHGIHHARGDQIAFLDADLEIKPDHIHDLLRRMVETGADVVVGTRIPQLRRVPPLRRIMSRTYRGLINFLFDLSLSETQTGIKLFRREVLKDCLPRLTVKRFAFDLELIVAARRFGYKIAEAPVVVDYKRAASLERIRPGQILRMILDTGRIYYRASFWVWLQPGMAAKLWMVVLAVGIMVFGVGVGKILNDLSLASPVKDIFYIIALQFLPRPLRNGLLVLFGLILAGVAISQLNKILLAAFARLDRGDLAGILHKRDRKSDREHKSK